MNQKSFESFIETLGSAKQLSHFRSGLGEHVLPPPNREEPQIYRSDLGVFWHTNLRAIFLKQFLMALRVR